MGRVALGVAAALGGAGCELQGRIECGAVCEPVTTTPKNDAPATLSGTVVLAGATANAGVALTLGDTRSSTTGAAGDFAFTDIPPGDYTLRGERAGYTTSERAITLAPGADKELTLTLERDPDTNAPPTIEALAHTPELPNPTTTFSVTAAASDPEYDPLSFRWEAASEFQVNDNGDEAQITAPAAPGFTGDVTVIVTDPYGGSASQSLQITLSGNAPPEVELTAAQESVAPNGTVELTASASDADGAAPELAWSVSDSAWVLSPDGASASLQAPNAYGAAVEVRVTATDDDGVPATARLTVATNACPNPEQVDCDQNASNGCAAPTSGQGPLCPAASCSAIATAAPSTPDGVYWLSDDPGEPQSGFTTYCDMSTEGGGWTLLGTISGAGDDPWAEDSTWREDEPFGSAQQPWQDFKSGAWGDLNITNNSILYQRRYAGSVAAQAVLGAPCLQEEAYFANLFAPPLGPGAGTLACPPADVVVLQQTEMGLSSAAYAEGDGAKGLGNRETNGLCWHGGDTSDDLFYGFFVWSSAQPTGPDACYAEEHYGGLGAHVVGTELGATADVPETAWLRGAEPEQTAISFFARPTVGIAGARTRDDPGRWADGSVAVSCFDYRAPLGAYGYHGDIGDGIYEIDPDGDGGVDPFLVDCDMTRAGGGWMQLRYAETMGNNDGVVIAENSRGNPWYKCDDDATKYFDFLDGTDETSVPPDTGSGDSTRTIEYINPATNETLSAAQLAALRQVVVALHPNTRMVAVIADNDNHNRQDSGSGSGLEVLIEAANGQRLLLTPGRNDECGGGGGSWPANNSESGFYLWNSALGASALDGDTGNDAPAPIMAAENLLPTKVYLEIHTGGGAAFGFERRTLLVR